MYSSSSQVGPEVDELDALVGRAKTVDAAEPLMTGRIPVDVVVDDRVAVLEVLALAHAVRGDQKVDFAVSCEVSGRSFERGENAVMMLTKSLRRLGSVVWLLAGAGDKAACMPNSFCAHPASSL